MRRTSLAPVWAFLATLWLAPTVVWSQPTHLGDTVALRSEVLDELRTVYSSMKPIEQRIIGFSEAGPLAVSSPSTP